MQLNALLPPNPRPPRQARLKWLRRTASGLLALILLLAPIGGLYQRLAYQRDLQQFPAPGKLLDIGGFRLHLYCTGQGQPTVVMEAGLGDGAFSWGLVQPAVAQVTRVCAYDRPGLGWSDFIDQAFRSEQVAHNLHTLLEQAGETGPYLLVGHSVGGVYLRQFAHSYPQEVSGLVLVDSAHESQVLRYEQPLHMGSSPLKSLLQACQVIAPTGFLRLTGVTGLTLSDSALPRTIQKSAAAWMNRTTYCRTIANELQATDLDLSHPEGPPSLGDLPLIVLTAGQGLDEIEPGDQASEAIWQQLQSELTALSSRGRQIIATHSGHYIQWSQPGLVIRAIRDLIGR